MVQQRGCAVASYAPMREHPAGLVQPFVIATAHSRPAARRCRGDRCDFSRRPQRRRVSDQNQPPSHSQQSAVGGSDWTIARNGGPGHGEQHSFHSIGSRVSDTAALAFAAALIFQWSTLNLASRAARCSSPSSVRAQEAELRDSQSARRRATASVLDAAKVSLQLRRDGSRW